MNPEVKRNWLSYLNQHYKLLVLTLCLAMIVINYFVIMSISHNHLSYTHLMYIPIVIAGSILGYPYGFAIGIIAGLVVGPFMPRFLDTGEPQFFWDWFFRMGMMVVVGLITGLVSLSYRHIYRRITNLEETHADSGFYNLLYLKRHPIEHQQTYTFASLKIFNHDTIKEVLGHDLYYRFLHEYKDRVIEKLPDAVLIQPNSHTIWILNKQKNFSDEIVMLVDLIKKYQELGETKVFVDYAYGFTSKKYKQGDPVSDYFIPADLSAKEAKRSFLTHMVYKDERTVQQFEYEILSDFGPALHHGDIYMVYQPKIDLKTKKPVGLEALIRWEHPIKRMIAPDQFIPAVEKTNMIHEMTLFVFRQVLEYQKKLNQANLHLPISINISAKNLYDHSFYDKMVEIFNGYNMPVQTVELEITETVLMEDPELSKRTLEKFANFGFKIAIDDFGKGYSSLAYLAQFPINIIKIDKFFSRQILINPTSQTIVKATIDLAKQLGYEILIEGIEDQETADLLERMGCHTAQGYLYMRPRREDDIIDYLKKQGVK